MRKRELEKIWYQLDGALEAIEKLQHEEEGFEDVLKYIDFSAIVNLKNDVEELIIQKSRKPVDLG